MTARARLPILSIARGPAATRTALPALIAVGIGLLLAAPVGTSAAPNAITYSRPFTNFTVSFAHAHGAAGCAAATEVIPPSFSARSGRLKAEMTSHAAAFPSSACQPRATHNGSSSYADADVQLTLPLSFNTSGNYTITAYWSVDLTQRWSLAPWKSCPLAPHSTYAECDVGAYISVFDYAYLTDTSNSSWGSYGSIFGNISSVGGYEILYSGSGGNRSYGAPGNHSVFHGVVTSVVPATGASYGAIHAGDHYTLYVEMEMEVQAYAIEFGAAPTGTAHATADLNLGSPGRSVTLLGVVIK